MKLFLMFKKNLFLQEIMVTAHAGFIIVTASYMNESFLLLFLF